MRHKRGERFVFSFADPLGSSHLYLSLLCPNPFHFSRRGAGGKFVNSLKDYYPLGMVYAQLRWADHRLLPRRRTLLDLLVKSQGTLPIEALQLALIATGHRYVDAALVQDDVAWLAQRDCLGAITDGVISISPYGERVAAGRHGLHRFVFSSHLRRKPLCRFKNNAASS